MVHKVLFGRFTMPTFYTQAQHHKEFRTQCYVELFTLSHVHVCGSVK